MSQHLNRGHKLLAGVLAFVVFACLVLGISLAVHPWNAQPEPLEAPTQPVQPPAFDVAFGPAPSDVDQPFEPLCAADPDCRDLLPVWSVVITTPNADVWAGGVEK